MNKKKTYDERVKKERKVVNRDEKLKYARLRAVGVRPPEAYKKAFNKPDAKPNTAARAARRIENDSLVREKMSKYEEEADKEAVMSRQERMERLSRKIKALDDAGDAKNMIACIAELNKMDGAYSPSRVEVKSDLVETFVKSQIDRAAAEPLVKLRAGLS